MDLLRAMEVFVKIVETGTLSGAARKLNLANASVTTSLRQLESRLGVVLLNRTTRAVWVTEQGADFYERSKAILAQVGDAEAALGGAQVALRGELHVDMPIAFGQLVLGPALAGFAHAHPGLRVSANLTNAVEGLVNRGIDVAVRMDEVEDAELVARPLYRSSHVLCAAPSWLEEHGVPSHPHELRTKECIGFKSYPNGELRHWAFRRQGEEVIVVPDGNLFFNSSDALMRIASNGAGLVYVLEVLADRYIRRGELVRILADWETDTQTFYAVFPKTRFMPAKVRAFVDFVLGLFPPDTPRGELDSVRVRRP